MYVGNGKGLLSYPLCPNASCLSRHVLYALCRALADLYRAEIAIIQSGAVSRLFRFLPNRIGDADSDQLPISHLNDE